MEHRDHVHLIRGGVAPGGPWADLGSGRGAFTLALAELLGPEAHIISVDKDRAALREQEQEMLARFPQANVEYLAADFTRPLDLPPLAGMILANSLHFHRDKLALLKRWRDYLEPAGRLVLVEYNADRGNPWVPHPIAYPAWEKLAAQAGFGDTRLLEARPSRFLTEIYSAVSVKAK